MNIKTEMATWWGVAGWWWCLIRLLEYSTTPLTSPPLSAEADLSPQDPMRLFLHCLNTLHTAPGAIKPPHARL